MNTLPNEIMELPGILKVTFFDDYFLFKPSKPIFVSKIVTYKEIEIINIRCTILNGFLYQFQLELDVGKFLKKHLYVNCSLLKQDELRLFLLNVTLKINSYKQGSK